MALRQRSDELREQREAARAARGPSTGGNRLFYLGGLVALVGVAVVFLMSPFGLVLMAVVGTFIGTLGITGHLDALAPLWDGVQQILGQIFPN